MPLIETSNIIVDFEIDADYVHLSIRNFAQVAVLRLHIRPSEPIIGHGGTKDLSRLSVFKEISYFAPGKEIRIFIDGYESFFANLKNTKISFTIAFEDEAGKEYRHVIHHELAIYKDLSFLIKKN